MSARSISRKHLRIRKPHKCWGCQKEFPVNTNLLREVMADAGEIYCVYTCRHCENWLEQNTEDWTPEDWETSSTTGVGYWKDNVWHPATS